MFESLVGTVTWVVPLTGACNSADVAIFSCMPAVEKVSSCFSVREAISNQSSSGAEIRITDTEDFQNDNRSFSERSSSACNVSRVPLARATILTSYLSISEFGSKLI